MPWYKAVCKNCHIGAGRNLEQTLYIFHTDIMRAITKFQKQGGVCLGLWEYC